MLGADTNPNQNRLLYPEAPTRNHDLKIPKNPPIWEFCNWLLITIWAHNCGVVGGVSGESGAFRLAEWSLEDIFCSPMQLGRDHACQPDVCLPFRLWRSLSKFLR